MIYSVLDFETTGFGPKESRILEVGIWKMESDGTMIDHFETLVNPGQHVGAVHVHGITSDMVAKAPRFGDIADILLEFLDGSVIAAHNAAFDIPFLAEELKRAGMHYDLIPSICTLQLSRKHILGRRSYSLENLCRDLRIENDLAHSALSDAKATAQLLLHLIGNYAIEQTLEESVLFRNNYRSMSFSFFTSLLTRNELL